MLPPNLIPISCSSRNLTTPEEAFNPNALPPVRRNPLIFGAVAIGSRSAISFVPGAPPLTSIEAIRGISEIIAVHPVLFSMSVQ